MEKKQFKGWGVLAAAFIMSFIPTAIMSNCFALYMNPVCEDLGFSNGAWSMVSMIGSITSAIGAMIIAGFYQKKNMKLFMIICTIGTCACFAVATMCTKIWQMYLVFGIENIFMSGLTQLPISMLVTAWFESKRSTMMAVAMSGTGVGGLLWSPVLTRFIEASATGWKTAMLFSSVVVLVVMILVALFLVKRSPQEYGTEPYRTGDVDESAPTDEGWLGVSKKTATHSGAWKYIIGTVLLVGALASGVTTHMPNFIATIADQKMAGWVLAGYSVVSIFGQLGGGILMDKIGIRKATFLAAVLTSLGLLSLIGAAAIKPILAYGYCIFFAAAMFLPKVLPAVLLSTVFGTQDYAGVYALSNIFFLIGAALGSILTSILQGILGYTGAWVVYIVIVFLMFIFVSGAIRNGQKLKEQYPTGEVVTE